MLNDRTKLNRWFVLLDAFVIIFAYLLSWFLCIELRDEIGGVLSREFYFGAIVIIVPIYLLCNTFFGLYKPVRTEDSLHEFYRVLQSNLIGLLILNTILFIGGKNPYLFNFSRVMLFTFGAINTISEEVARYFARFVLRRIRSKGFNQKHILLVGYSDACFKFIDKIKRNPGWGYKIFGIIDDTHKIGTDYRGVKVIGDIKQLYNTIENNNFDEVDITLALNEYDKLREVVYVSEKLGVHTRFVPDYGTIISTNPVSEDLDGLPVINIRAVPLQSLFNRFFKRTIDIIGSIVGIIIFSPFMIVISILIKMSSKGPIVFKQERVGRHNKLFVMYKFRSMVEQPDEEEKNKWTTENDDRVTKVGKFIRRTSLDEILQFFNVLKGDMSLVGPRPERLQFVEKFKETIPRYMIKHQVRPGMTGWAQINGLRGDTPIDRRIQYDLWYIENWTLGLDIKILLLTLVKGFVDKNAY